MSAGSLVHLAAGIVLAVQRARFVLMVIGAVILLTEALATGQAGVGVAAVLKQGQRLEQKGQMADAQQLYQQALKKYPGDFRLQSELGMVFFQENDWPRAIEHLRIGVRDNPKSADLLFYLSFAYFSNSELKVARETIAKAAALSPNDARVCQKFGEYLTMPGDRNEEGLSWLIKARRLDPNLQRIDFEIGAAQLAQQDYKNALENLDAAQKKAPEDGHIAFLIGQAWAGLADWEKAVEFYNLALLHGAADAATYYGLGEVLRQSGHPADSIDAFQKALAMQPGLIEAHLQLGKAYRSLGRISDAQHENTVFSEIKDRSDRTGSSDVADDKKSWEDLKSLLQAGKEQEALDYLARLAATHKPNFPNPSYVLGVEYFRMGRNEAAERWLLKAFAETPAAAVIPAHLGLVHMATGDLPAAEAWFQSALKVDPADRIALAGLGELSFLQARWPEAIDYLEKSKTSDPSALLILSDAYFRAGNSDQAIVTAEIARGLASGNQPLLDAINRLLESHTAPSH